MSHCRVYLLDELKIDIGVDLHAHGRQLLESVCKYLNLVEVDYFGLKYKGEHYDGIWVRMDKSIKKQFPIHPSNWEFVFTVKFYPSDPSYLKEETTKYQLSLQIRENLVSGKLQCPLDTLIVLSSYWLQSEFGDGEEASDEVREYLASLKQRLGENRSDPDFEEKVEKAYKSRRGMPQSDADLQFLRFAGNLPLYGVHFYNAKNEKEEDILVGIGSVGVIELKGKETIARHKWSLIKNINYQKSKFYLKLLPPNKKGNSTKKIYHLKSYVFAKAMWRDAVDQHVFFRVPSSDKQPTGTSPAAAKKKDITKRKRALSLSFSFRKKKPKTEAEVREESSRIGRPNPAVIRHSSLRKPASPKSESSHEINSSESSSINDDETVPKKIEVHAELMSRNKDLEEEKTKPEARELNLKKQSFSLNFSETDETNVKEPFPPDNSLLIRVTIPEEDEDVESPEKSTASSSSKPTSPDSGLKPDPQLPAIIATPSQPKIVVTSTNEPEAICPVVTVDVCEENPRRVSLDVSNSKNSTFLPPPLLSQSTRDAILPYVEQEKQEINNKPSLEPSNDDSKEIKDEGTGSTSINNKKTDVNVSFRSGSQIPDFHPFVDFSKTEKQDDVEDDRRTLGGFSHVAVHGDDDTTIKDLMDDDPVNQSVDYEKDINDNESRITESSDSNISSLTDNTDDLCNPNILEIIWEKCHTGKDYGYREIFGVKLRKVRGRQREIKSFYDYDQEQQSVGTQVPTPPPAKESEKNKKNEGKQFFSDGSRFIPSWPFDPDSLAHNTELDELDKEAIKVALKTQSESKSEILLDEVSASSSKNDFVKNSNTNLDSLSFPDQETDTDSIPGIPDFYSSVRKCQKSSEQEPLLNEFPKLSDSQFAISTSDKKSAASNIKPLIKKPVSTPLTSEKEPLIYPPDIQTFPHRDKDPGVITYQPKPDPSTSNKDVSRITLLTSVVETDDETSANQINQSVKNQTLESNITQIPEDDLNSTNLMKIQHSAVEIVDSGRSTPSSVSSFPRFVHSVYPLRKMSKNWGGEPVESPENQKVNNQVEGEEVGEYSIDLSDCSNKSVKGSSESSILEQHENLHCHGSESVSESLSTQITTMELTSETVVFADEGEIGNFEEKTEEIFDQRNLSSSNFDERYEYLDDFYEESSCSPKSSSVKTEKSAETQSESSHSPEISDQDERTSSIEEQSELSIDLSTISLPNDESQPLFNEASVEEFSIPEEIETSGSQLELSEIHELSCPLRFQPPALLVSSETTTSIKMYDVDDDDSFSSDSADSHEYAFSNPSEVATTQRSAK